MASQSRERTAAAMSRMDDFTGTVSECSAALADMTRLLEETKSSKEQLQAVLEKKKQRTAMLRAQVEALKVRQLGQEEQEKVQLLRIEHCNEKLQTVKAILEKSRARGEELRRLITQRVTEFEETTHSIALQFQSLQLLDKDVSLEAVEKTIEEQVKELEREVLELEAEQATLTAPPTNCLPTDTLLTLHNEVFTTLEELKKKIIQLRDEEQVLKSLLNRLQQKGSPPVPTSSQPATVHHAVQ